jgi:hypothetical protein
MPCDICSATQAETVITPEAMSEAVKRGFNPFQLNLIPPSLARLSTPDYPAKWSRQAIDGILSHSEWTLCPPCRTKLEPFLRP